MKWFMAANSESLRDPGFMRLVRVASASARAHTELESFLMLDGPESAECDEIRALGVTILPAELSIAPELTAWMENHQYTEIGIRCRRGSYLRMELPRVLEQHGIDDEFVMYTDADVFFNACPEVDSLKPPVLAAYGAREGGFTRFHFLGHYHFQAGVLVMRTAAVRETYDLFRKFVLSNGNGIKRPPGQFFSKHLFLSDQVAINLFYGRQITRMHRELNWNPASRPCSSPQITHFNGLKWTEWHDFAEGKLSSKRQKKFARQIGQNIEAYRRICEEVLQFESQLPQAPSHDGALAKGQTLPSDII